MDTWIKKARRTCSSVTHQKPVSLSGKADKERLRSVWSKECHQWRNKPVSWGEQWDERSSLLLLGGGLSLFSSSLFRSRLSLRTFVKIKMSTLLTNWKNELFLGEVLDQGSCDGTIDLELFTKHSSGDTEDFGDFLKHTLVGFVIQIYSKVKLFLYLNFGPWLFLCFSTFWSSFRLCRLCILGRALTRILRAYLLLLCL